MDASTVAGQKGTPRVLGHKAQLEVRVAARAQGLLERHFPSVIRREPYAVPKPAACEAALQEIARITDADFALRVHRAVDVQLRNAMEQGWWTGPTLGYRAQHVLAPSLLELEDASTIAAVVRWRARLVDALPALAAHGSAAEIGGALLLAAVVLDALLIADFLPQMLRAAPSSHPTEWWLRFTYSVGRYETIVRCRRWVLGEITGGLYRRWMTFPADQREDLTANACLTALEKVLKAELPKHLGGLVAAGRCYWARELSPLLFDWATRKDATESLSDGVVTRWLRPRQREKLLAREIRRGLTLSRAPVRPRAAPLPKLSPTEQLVAFRALRGLLSKGRHGKAHAAALQKNLKAWATTYSAVGGWVAILGAWVSDLLSRSRPEVKCKPLRATSAYRYLCAFGRPLIELAGDLDPLDVTETELMARLETLRWTKAGGTATVLHSAFSQFLCFAERYGVPQVDLVDWWGSPARNGAPRANFLFPNEFLALLDGINTLHAGFHTSFDNRSTRVMAILLYRTGLRWSEVETLPVRALRELGDESLSDTTLQVMATEHIEGKTSNFERALPLDKLVPRAELGEIRAYFRDLREQRWHSQGVPVLAFASPLYPDRPSDRKETHDTIVALMRHITGDQSMVIHHLRHTAASTLALRALGDDGDAYGGRVFNDGPALPVGASSYGEWLTGRPGTTHAVPVALARLFGHLDVEVTSTFYIHVAEWILADRARRCAPVLRAAASAALSGIRVDSVYRRTHRQRNTPVKRGLNPGGKHG